MNYENLYFCVLFYKAIKYLSEGGHTKYQCKNKHRKNLSSSFSQTLGIHVPSIYGEKKKEKTPSETNQENSPGPSSPTPSFSVCNHWNSLADSEVKQANRLMQLNAEINILDLQQKLELSKNPLNRHPENAMPAQWGWLHRKEYIRRSH